MNIVAKNTIRPQDLKDIEGVTKARKSKVQAAGKTVATINHDIMHFLASLALPALFFACISNNLLLGWYQGGFLVGSIILMLAYGSTDISMAYFLKQVFTVTNSLTKRFICALGLSTSMVITMVSLVASVQMMDSYHSVDYGEAKALQHTLDLLDDQQDKMFSFGQPGNAASMRKDIMSLAHSVGEAEAKAIEKLGHHPSQAAFVEGGAIHTVTGLSFSEVRMILCILVLINYILLAIVFRVDWTDDGLQEVLDANVIQPSINDERKKDHKRVYEGSELPYTPEPPKEKKRLLDKVLNR